VVDQLALLAKQSAWLGNQEPDGKGDAAIRASLRYFLIQPIGMLPLA